VDTTYQNDRDDAETASSAGSDTPSHSRTSRKHLTNSNHSASTASLTQSRSPVDRNGAHHEHDDLDIRNGQGHRSHNSSSSGTSIIFDISSSMKPAQRRRAKRTEEERIEYLRSDPYVAQFEAYKVLCKSCDKWIRLRPNSTYCSIPWDAHRKSCLAKKV
jgi:hypothetical protein